MGAATESVRIEASLAETWDFYFEPGAWPSWVDGFDRVDSSDGYPEEGGTLVWRSRPAGRGRVTERVLEHQPRRRHRVAYEDPESEGELLTTFQIEGDEVEVTQEWSYRMKEGGVLAPITDRLFVRGQVRGSLARSLGRLKLEVEDLSDADSHPGLIRPA
jgi:hypothetical protein